MYDDQSFFVGNHDLPVPFYIRNVNWMLLGPLGPQYTFRLGNVHSKISTFQILW